VLFPEENGTFICKKDDFATDNLFEYMEHFGIEYDWMVRLNHRFTLNLFSFLSEMAKLIDEGQINEAWDHLQSVTLLLINASGEDFDEFIEEAQVIAGSAEMVDQIERYLDDNDAE
jgi:hypothetical protein